MKKQLLFLFIALGFSIASTAEMVYKSGYVILNSGDTVRGDIKVNTKKELPLFAKVILKQGETSKTYKPEQVKGYSLDGTQFLTRKLGGEMVFLKVVTSGRIIIFEHQFEVYHGDQTLVEKEFYVEKNDGVSNELVKMKGNKFKKLSAELMSDHSELVAKINQEDKKMEFADMQAYIEEYNSWHNNQSQEARGTR
jgi:alpha-L-fucosidase